MATERRRHTFIHADGQRTTVSSEASSPTHAARPPGFESSDVLHQRALDTIQQSAAAEEEKSKEKEGAKGERMDVGDVQDPGQDEEPTGGEGAGGGSGIAG